MDHYCNHSSYRLEGCYFLFHKIGETTYWPGHIIPIVRVKIARENELPENLEEFNALEYVQTAVTECDDPLWVPRGRSYVNGYPVEEWALDECGFLPEYRLELLNTSKRVIPKKLVYIGNYEEVIPPQIEFVPEDISIPGFLWKYFDESMMKRYCKYNLGQSELYSKRSKYDNQICGTK